MPVRLFAPAGEETLTSFATVQRAIERYRVFVTSIAQDLVNGGAQNPVRIRPDMDNTYVANNGTLSGLHDAQRYVDICQGLTTC